MKLPIQALPVIRNAIAVSRKNAKGFQGIDPSDVNYCGCADGSYRWCDDSKTCDCIPHAVCVD